jgi:hypothetical protein
MKMKISQNLRILEWVDGDVSIESYTDTGFFEGAVYISSEDLPKLIKALQDIQNKRFDTESKDD